MPSPKPSGRLPSLAGDGPGPIPPKPRVLQPAAMRQRPSGIIKTIKKPAINWNEDDTTESDESDEAEAEMISPGSSRQRGAGAAPGGSGKKGLEGRKLRLGLGGAPAGTGASFRTPEEEAAEDARRMRLFRGMQATVVMVVLATAVMVSLSIIEVSAASGCSVDAVLEHTRVDPFTLTIDTRHGLKDIVVTTFAGGITVLRDTATQGLPTITVSIALFASDEGALGQLTTSAALTGANGDRLEVSASAAVCTHAFSTAT